jgi:hypothetical protein
VTELKAFVITPDSIPTGYDSIAGEDPVAGLSALGRALLASPAWPDSVGATVISGWEPKLVLAGWFPASTENQLIHLRNELAETRVRYFSYPEVEAAVGQLAERLRSALPDLEEWAFAAIPRGGLILLGMLSYSLELKAGQLEDSHKRPTVLVDDCVISGRRMRSAVTASPAPRLAIASLVSTPELRSRFIEHHGPRLETFCSPIDLTDTAPERYGDAYPEWRERWSSRTDDIWIGRPEHVAFPWNEPDVSLWNDESGRSELAWRLVPPERCLKNRTRLGPELEVFELGSGPMRQAPGIVDLAVADSVVAVDLATARALSLDGTAAQIWKVLMRTGSVDDTIRAIAGEFGDTPRVESETREFLAELEKRGLIGRFDDSEAP